MGWNRVRRCCKRDEWARNLVYGLTALRCGAGIPDTYSSVTTDPRSTCNIRRASAKGDLPSSTDGAFMGL